MPAFGSISSTTYATRTNTTVTAPSGISNGDKLYYILATAAAEAPDPTPPSGFTLLSGPSWPVEVTAFSLNVETRIYEKTASGESGDYTATHSSCSTQGVMVRVTSPGLSDPAPTVASGLGATATATGFTTDTDNSLIMLVVHDFLDSGDDRSPPTGTTPTFTERLDGGTSLYYVATGVLSPAGATGNKSMTVRNGGTSPWVAIMWAVEPPASGITGTVAVTLGAFTSSASGTFTPPAVTGTSAVTLAPFTSTASGTSTPPAVTGTAAVTLAPFTPTASGTFTPPAVTGTAAVTLAPFVAAASGTVAGPGTITGTAAVTLGPFVAVASGTRTLPAYTGTAAVTLAPFTPTASGTVIAPLTGTSAVTLAPFTSTASGTVGLPAITGTVAVTLGPFVASGSQQPFGGSGVGTIVWRDSATATVAAAHTGTGTVNQP